MSAEPLIDEESAAPVGVPAVVAVVVTSTPGRGWRRRSPPSARQDYPNLSVLVIDAASDDDPTPRIAAVLPSAYVRRLDENPGFGAAANDVLGVVEGASHYVFLHDDAAPDPDAIRLLVEEAFRSNAGIVSPKLVEWDEPLRLLGVGASADKAGVVRPYGRHELDQEQHDAVRDVFVAPGRLHARPRRPVRDARRVRPRRRRSSARTSTCAGGPRSSAPRVVVAPSARVRHREATVDGRASARPRRTRRATSASRSRRLHFRHRLRTVLKALRPAPPAARSSRS